MINYTYTFNASGDVQTALNNGSLGKPYVAYIQNESRVDYNSKSPAPSYKGVWNDVKGDQTVYTFTIVDDSPSLWSEDVLIGTINCQYIGEASEPVQGNVDINLFKGSEFNTIYLSSEDKEYNENITFLHSGYDYSTETLSIKQSDDPTDSNWEPLTIKFENDVFTFNEYTNTPINLTTINPTK